MHVGFSAGTGQLVESHKILAWSFSNSNFSIGDALVTTHLPSFELPKDSVFRSKGFILGVSVGGLLIMGCGVVVYMVCLKRKGKKMKDVEETEDWELEYWPHRVSYQEIHAATKGFSEENVIGLGGNGKVYKGQLLGVEVALKRISLDSEHGMREFLAEVSSLGRLKHRNLVGLRGWCKKEKESLILIYDYMENGSLDKWIFECDESIALSWEQRIKVLKDVASGILYLYEGWESKVLHRDIKASNVLLDKKMNARLGDFGLAKMHHHGQVMSGRRPIEEGKRNLVDRMWSLTERSELLSVLDERLKAKGGYADEVVEKVLHLGLLCAHPEANSRPTIRQVLKMLEGQTEGTGLEDEGMNVHLLKRIGTRAMTSSWKFAGSRGHPTFNEINKNRSSSPSLNASDVLLEGR
ncbi:hypothetical protein CISIN_1g048535mg [Citrus sinensis]|uniref:non-specific serine/threonine protein kinase n=1 Tax=Citrus sinensis TaxID=2711 RepID=A0A067EJ23_CITSI|nr:hypothetical protein CISIN_1g048535mg [Citrus sinensis]